MSRRAVLEVIALGVEDAVAARDGGADRLELVTDMAADGLTPAVAAFAGIRAAVDIPLRVMLRLTDGFAAGDVGWSAAACGRGSCGGPGPTSSCSGSSTPTVASTCAAVERVVAELDGCRWTFHRAIDRAADRDALRKELHGLPGLDTYLTAGSAAGVDDGLPTLLAEAARRGEPGYEQRLLVGGGLRSGACAAAACGGSGRVSYRGCGSARGVGGACVGGGGGGVAGGAGRGLRWAGVFRPRRPYPSHPFLGAAPQTPYRP